MSNMNGKTAIVATVQMVLFTSTFPSAAALTGKSFIVIRGWFTQ